MAKLPQKEVSWRNKIRAWIIKLLGVYLNFCWIISCVEIMTAGGKTMWVVKDSTDITWGGGERVCFKKIFITYYLLLENRNRIVLSKHRQCLKVFLLCCASQTSSTPAHSMKLKSDQSGQLQRRSEPADTMGPHSHLSACGSVLTPVTFIFMWHNWCKNWNE